MSKPYRPSNGSEGLDFQEDFCSRCKKDRESPEGCQILTDVYAYMPDDPRYPKEWITDEQGPRCTAFEASK